MKRHLSLSCTACAHYNAVLLEIRPQPGDRHANMEPFLHGNVGMFVALGVRGGWGACAQPTLVCDSPHRCYLAQHPRDLASVLSMPLNTFSWGSRSSRTTLPGWWWARWGKAPLVDASGGPHACIWMDRLHPARPTVHGYGNTPTPVLCALPKVSVCSRGGGGGLGVWGGVGPVRRQPSLLALVTHF